MRWIGLAVGLAFGLLLVPLADESAGLIGYRCGQIAILDRSGLEAVAYDCYRLVRREADRFFREPPT